MRLSLCILLFLSFPVVFAENSSKLPDPLSLESALSFANEHHPNVALVEQAIAIAKSRTAIIESQNGIMVRAQARARWVDPPEPTERYGRDDHQGKLLASKSLYDFGRTSHHVDAAKLHESIEFLRLQQVKQQQKIEVMQAFFDVLITDLTYVRDNEAMTMAFLDFDKAKDRGELGQRSDVDILELEALYFEKRKIRYKTESFQRLLRNQLSIILNRPGDIVSKLHMPKLDYSKYKPIALKQLQEAALSENLELKKLQLSIDALRLEMKSIRANRHPMISAEVEAGLYERNIGSNDRWRAGLVLDVPLYQGGKISHQLGELKARITQKENELYQAQLQLKQKILNHWLALDVATAQTESAMKRYEYQELYLDRARAIYEMEFKTDLGDSMVQLSEAELQMAEAEFENAMHWEKLRILTQMKLEDMRQ